MNRNALIEVLESTFSSDVQKEQARAGLYLLDNPDRITPVELVPPADPGKLPAYEWLAALADSTISDEGSPARKAWIAGADLWLKAALENPALSPELKIQAQARYDVHTKSQTQYFAEQDAMTAARKADDAASRARLQAAHPGWNNVQLYNAMIDLGKAEGNVTWRLISGVPTKIKFDDKWETWTVFTDDSTDDAAVRETARRAREATARAEAKALAEQLAAAEVAAQPVPKVLTAAEQNVKDQELASIAWNRAMGLCDTFKPGQEPK